MTCIVGIAEKGTVYMGADSIAVAGYDMVTRASPKMFRLGPFIIGCAGSLRMLDILRYKFHPPEIASTVTLHEYMATAFVDALRDTLKSNGVLSVEDNVEEIPSSQLLVAFQGCLFEIDDDMQVGVNTHPFASIGCGHAVAMGALHASKGTPRQRLRMALEAAETFNAGVRRPFRYLLSR